MPLYRNTSDEARKVKVDQENNVFETVEPGDKVNIPENYGENLGWEDLDVAVKEEDEDDGEEQNEEVEGQAGAQDNGQGEEGETGEEKKGDGEIEGGSESEQEGLEFESWSEAFKNLNVDESKEAIDAALKQSDNDSKQLIDDAIEAEKTGQERVSVIDYLKGKRSN